MDGEPVFGEIHPFQRGKDLALGLDLGRLANDGTTGNVLDWPLHHALCLAVARDNAQDLASIPTANHIKQLPGLLPAIDCFCHDLIIR